MTTCPLAALHLGARLLPPDCKLSPKGLNLHPSSSLSSIQLVYSSNLERPFELMNSPSRVLILYNLYYAYYLFYWLLKVSGQ